MLYAWKREQAGAGFQLCVAGRESAGGASATFDPSAGRSDIDSHVEALRHTLRRGWATFYSTGALLRALLLQIFYSVRSERMLMQQLDYNLLFRWFVGMTMDEPVWNHAVFSKNRERLLNEETAREFFTCVLAQAQPHLSKEHFSVDGTLIEAWASQKSFQPKDGDGEGADFHGQQRRNETHQSRTDPDAKLVWKVERQRS